MVVGCSDSDSNNSVTGAAVSDEVIKIPVDEITNEVKKYEYDANGVTVTYFVVRGSDGEVRTAFDACDVCGGHKGYRQQGNVVVCNNCEQTFKIDDLGEKNSPGGCWPSKLSHTIVDNNVVVKVSELQAGKFRFA